MRIKISSTKLHDEGKGWIRGIKKQDKATGDMKVS